MVSDRVRKLAEAIQLETDPDRMAELAAALIVALDEPREPAKEPLPVHNQDKVRILVADDNEIIRKVLCDVLRSEPAYEVVCESLTAGDTINKAEELQPNVVVLDISLPDMNGIEVVRQIRQVAPSAEILLCSQHELEYIVKAGIAAGARGYLLKSEAVKELVPAITAVTRGEQYISPGILFPNR
jgi:DNA-binding NarL/FixJ family response regulator